MILLTIFIIIKGVRSTERIYEKGDKLWTCEDRGSYGIFCGSLYRPERVTCLYTSLHTWECTPAKNNEWLIQHCHSCNDNYCSLHTIAKPKKEFPPLAMVIIICILVILMIRRF